MARFWLGITLIMTTVASRPMMTITTISSTRVKPLWEAAAAGCPPLPLSCVSRRGGNHLQGKWWGEGAAAGRWQRGRECIFMWIPETDSAEDEGVELQDRQQDRQHDHCHDPAHGDDDHRLEQAHRDRGEGVEFAFEIVGGAFEHRRQAPAVLDRKSTRLNSSH